jgi:hypothetical protein
MHWSSILKATQFAGPSGFYKFKANRIQHNDPWGLEDGLEPENASADTAASLECFNDAWKGFSQHTIGPN